MTRIIFNTATTANGWIATEDHSLDWLFRADAGDAGERTAAFQAGVGALVEGSHTYEWVLRTEKLLDRPELWAQFYGDRPTFVFTNRELPIPAGADVRFLRGSVAEALPVLRAAAGEGDLWIVGGGELAGQFLDADALDGIILSIAPAFLPAGAPLLPRTLGPERLRLDSVDHSGQFAHLRYSVLPVTAPDA